MASILNVDQINNAAGTSGIALDASTGKASFPNSVTIPNGATMPAGSVIQVVQVVQDSTLSNTMSSSFTDVTALSANITPSSSSNKVLVVASLEGGMGVNGLNATGRFRILRDGSTQIAKQTIRTYDYGGNGIYIASSTIMTLLDAPSTTSQTTYNVQMASITGDNVFINPENGTSTLTLMEIAQ